jgi:HD-GYP domain-containing protein (c-di-GMP phosphodiesterase class II)
LNSQLRIVLPPIWAAGAAAFCAAAWVFATQTPSTPQIDTLWMSALLVLAVLSEMKPVPYTLGGAHKDESLTITLILLALFVFGWPAAVLLAASSVVVADLAASKPYYKILFNGSMYALAALAAGMTYQLSLMYLPTPSAILPSVWDNVLVRFVPGVVYYLVNVILLMLVLSRAQGLRLSKMIVWGVRDSALVNLALITIAIGMSVLWELHPAAALVLVPPLFVAMSGYQAYTRLRLEAEAMLATLADILDLRDHYTGHHSLRVSEASYEVARQLGLSEEQALAIKAIARVHDVGKVAVRDAVLLKAGPLSPHERLEAQGHVEAGGRILSHLSVYGRHLPILNQHHERMDGRGYPHGLQGESIEVGARILTACDVFDTLTSDRPYRPAMSSEAAMGELYRHAGSQFDPRVVEALERFLIQTRRLKRNWRVSPDTTSPGDAQTLSPTQTEPHGQEGPVSSVS